MKSAKLTLLLWLVPLLGLVSCAPEEGGEEAADTQEMEMAMTADTEAFEAAMIEARAAWKAAYEAGDAAAVAAMYTDDAMYLPTEAPMITGKAAIEQAFGEVIAMTASRGITINATESGVTGDMGYMVGNYTLTTTAEAGAEPTTVEGKYVTITKRAADGTWKIHVHMANYNQPVQMPAEEMKKEEM
ncbi:MAG: SgcJ/EcaC family oxidoreductase [Gemmatimonadota bacterium]|nr:MAG: SgcJ/EcaC family oxidoreductase [Gemmatimonadota bacterium]